MDEINHRRNQIENRIINMCVSRHLKNGIMRDIDDLCEAIAKRAVELDRVDRACDVAVECGL